MGTIISNLRRNGVLGGSDVFLFDRVSDSIRDGEYVGSFLDGVLVSYSEWQASFPFSSVSGVSEGVHTVWLAVVDPQTGREISGTRSNELTFNTASYPIDGGTSPGDGSGGDGGGGGSVVLPTINTGEVNDGLDDFSIGSIPMNRETSGIFLTTQEGIDSGGELRGGGLVVDSRPGEIPLAALPGPIRVRLTGGIEIDSDAESFDRDGLLKRERLAYELRFGDVRLWDRRRGAQDIRHLVCRADVNPEINALGTIGTGGSWSATLVGHEGSWRGESASLVMFGDGVQNLDPWRGCTSPLHDLTISIDRAVENLEVLTGLTRLVIRKTTGPFQIRAAAGIITNCDDRDWDPYSESGWGSLVVVGPGNPFEIPWIAFNGLGGAEVTITGPRRYV